MSVGPMSAISDDKCVILYHCHIVNILNQTYPIGCQICLKNTQSACYNRTYNYFVTNNPQSDFHIYETKYVRNAAK